MSRWYRYAFLALWLLAGCTGTRKIVAPSADPSVPLPRRTAAELLKDLRSAVPPESFEIHAQIQWEQPNRRMAFTGRIYFIRDSLFATFSPGLGIQVARLLVTRDSLFFFNRLENTLYYASLGDLSRVVAYPLSLEGIVRLLTGTVHPPSKTYQEATVLPDGYLLETADGTTTLKLLPNLKRLSLLTLYNENQPVFTGLYADWRGNLPSPIPYRLVLSFPRVGQSLTLRYRSFKPLPSSFHPNGLGLRPHTRRQSLASLHESFHEP